MKLQAYLIALSSALVAPMVTLAQPKLDIQLTNTADGITQVLAIPDGDFSGVFSSVVLTIAWDSTIVLQEPYLHQSDEVRAYIPITISGPALNVGAMKYRKYAGIGFVPMHQIGAAMHAQKSFQLGWVGAHRSGTVFIAQEPWLAEKRHNGSYYVSLNGLDRTGKIIQAGSEDAIADELEITVSPNPYSGGPLNYSIMNPEQGMMEMNLIDAGGKLISSSTSFIPSGRSIGTVSGVDMLSAGGYALRVFIGDRGVTIPLIVGSK